MAIGLLSDQAASWMNHAAVLRNLPAARLYERALAGERALITSSGALATYSGAKTGRSPKDKRIVDRPQSHDDVWWGPVNSPLSPESFVACRGRALGFLDQRPALYVVDGYAGWDPQYRVKVRVVSARAYHALFMRNLLIPPTAEELASNDPPGLTIWNAGDCEADPTVPGITSSTSVALDLERGEMLILGTNYAGEMKKGVFTALHFAMPRRGVLSMHCSANQGGDGDVTLFFGLSGTGKTTLSSDPRRRLIGDDEHCWSDEGVFNIEGGCYAKCIGLRHELEPQIHGAIRFGAVLENVVVDPATRVADYADGSITENTRACYPIDFIDHALIPCVGPHPRNIIFLACDAFGVLPPVSRLSGAQAMYHFLSGYTAKMAGTEVGVVEPQTTFSACFGAAFLVLHPARYAEMLAERMRSQEVNAWLINTGWTGGPYGVGSRIKLKDTRAIIDAIHDGSLLNVPTRRDPWFNLEIPVAVPGVSSELLEPRGTWIDREAYDRMAAKLARQFQENFGKVAEQTSDEVRAAGPRI